MRKYPVSVRIAVMQREVAKSREVYARLVTKGKMRQSEADYIIDVKQDIHDGLCDLRDYEPDIIAMIAAKKAEGA